MDRRSFLQTTGLGAAAALVSRTGVAAMPTTTALVVFPIDSLSKLLGGEKVQSRL